MNLISFELCHPFCAIASGASGSGKSTAIANLIERRNEIISHKIDNIMYVYSEWQPLFYRLQASVPTIKFTTEVKDILDIGRGPSLVIIDDKMDSISKGEEHEIVTNYFTKLSHHRSASVILVVQNPFQKSLRTCNINSHYLLLCDQPRDRSVVSTLARQIFPGKSQFLVEAFNKAVVDREYGMLFLDLHPRNKTFKCLARSNIFPDPDCLVFLPSA